MVTITQLRQYFGASPSNKGEDAPQSFSDPCAYEIFSFSAG